MSAPMNESELDFCRDLGFFTAVAWHGRGKNECYTTKKHKIGKIYKYTRKTILTEEVLARDLPIVIPKFNPKSISL
jgi:hypothetical protein